MQPRRILFCDIDHVLSDAFHRDHMIDKDHSVVTEPVWELYHTAAKNDKPVFIMIELVNAMFSDAWQVVLITARPNWCRSITQNWLRSHAVMYDQLIMRPDSGERYRMPSPKLKSVQIVDYIKGFNIGSQDDVLLIDDRKDICDAMAEIGVQTLQFSYNRHTNGKAKEVWSQEVAPQAAAE